MRWLVREFGQLTTIELHDLLRLRIDVFIVEQRCAYPEVDGKDPESTHLLGYRNDALVACARWYPQGDDSVLGRIAVRQGARGEGLGARLLHRAVSAIGPRTIRISAQQPLESYYQTLGFDTVSEPYDDFGIPHVDMMRRQGAR